MAPRRKTNPLADPRTRDLVAELSAEVIGQSAAVQGIIPSLEVFQAGLSPAGRPAGVFLLLGCTGTGKTHTVESLARVLHGHKNNVLRIDCGEYQMDHEVAKLIGAPPGYLGHRETQPLLTQFRLSSVSSETSPLSIILFDEIEKAAGSLKRLLLGVLDHGILRLGDNTVVTFENSLVFFTSNLGSQEMLELSQDPHTEPEAYRHVGERAMHSYFSPEFINRLDSFFVYTPLTAKDTATIVDLAIRDFSTFVQARLGLRSPEITFTPAAAQYLAQHGFSPEFGGRELKRVFFREVLVPLAKARNNSTVNLAWARFTASGGVLHMATGV